MSLSFMKSYGNREPWTSLVSINLRLTVCACGLLKKKNIIKRSWEYQTGEYSFSSLVLKENSMHIV